jgi:hypothetical protein
MGTGSFPGVKRLGLGVEHPSNYSAEVKERVELYLIPLWDFVACSRTNFTLPYLTLPYLTLSYHVIVDYMNTKFIK